MKKELLKKFYLLYQSISNTEDTILPDSKYINVNWYVIFDDIIDKFDDLYKEFDKEEYSLLNEIKNIVDSDYTTFDFDKLTDKERKELKDEDWNLLILTSNYEEYPHWIVKLKDLDETIEYVIKTFQSNIYSINKIL